MSYPLHIFEKLEAGEIVSWRPKGNSMTPKIKSGQLCGKRYLHLISAIQGDRFQISNNHGHVNGWTRKIYGRLVCVEP